MITGSGAVVGDELSGNPKVGIVSMTGSVEVGAAIMATAAENITKVILELGGKVPTLLANCTQDIDTMHEETFGPVLPLCTFRCSSRPSTTTRTRNSVRASQ